MAKELQTLTISIILNGYALTVIISILLEIRRNEIKKEFRVRKKKGKIGCYRAHLVLHVLVHKHPVRRVLSVNPEAQAGDSVEPGLVMCCFLAKVPFHENDDLRVRELGARADAVDVALEEGELLGDLCLKT